MGPVLHSDTGLSFWGGVDPTSGVVIDCHHPLHGENVSGKVFCIPSGRGSCTGSQVLLELLLEGHAPAAIILSEPDHIVALGVIVAEELFERSLPVVCLSKEDFARLSVPGAVASVRGGVVHVASSSQELEELVNATPAVAKEERARNPHSTTELELSASDLAMLDGDMGRAAQVAMSIVVRVAHIQGAPSLLDIAQAHIDGCTYIGPGGLRFAQRLRDWEGKVSVPTTLNSISVDRQQWRALGVQPSLGEPASALADAYLDLGAKPSYTCAPYLLDSKPKLGDQVSWGESNAVVYANSVLGARTQKYADYLDICCAIVGRVPRAGCHLEEHRRATLVIEAPWPSELKEMGVGPVDDSIYPLLGHICGDLAGAQIPVITNLDYLINDDPERRTASLKAFSAAFGTTGSAPMFHIAGVTPEADSVEAALGHKDPADVISISASDLVSAWRELDGDTEGRDDGVEEPVGLVALGNPHLCVEECAELAQLVKEQPGALRKNPDTDFVLTLGTAVLKEARKQGHSQVLEQFGATLVTDTCWCMLDEAVVGEWCTRAESKSHQGSDAVIITNSAKYAHYGPGLVQQRFRFGSLKMCVTAAATGKAPRSLPRWLNGRNGLGVPSRSYSQWYSRPSHVTSQRVKQTRVRTSSRLAGLSHGRRHSLQALRKLLHV